MIGPIELYFLVLSRYCQVNSVGGTPRQIAMVRYTNLEEAKINILNLFITIATKEVSHFIWRLMADCVSWPVSTRRRNSLENSRSLDLRSELSLVLDSQEKDSGKHFLGIRPYLEMTLTTISHWPPSQVGSLNKKDTSLPSTGSPRLAVSTMLFRKKWHRSTYRKKINFSMFALLNSHWQFIIKCDQNFLYPFHILFFVKENFMHKGI